MAIHRARATGLFSEVIPDARNLEAEYVLSGELDRLEYDCCGEVPAAVVELRLSVTTAAGEPVATVRGGGRRELSEATPYRFVVAANAMLADSVDRLLESVEAWEGM